MPNRIKNAIEDSKRLRQFKLRQRGRIDRKKKSKINQDNKYISSYKR